MFEAHEAFVLYPASGGGADGLQRLPGARLAFQRQVQALPRLWATRGDLASLCAVSALQSACRA